MMICRLIMVVVALMCCCHIQCESRSMSLYEAIAIAKKNSVDAAVALNELKTAYWEYRTFRANLLPEITFSSTLPSYNKYYNSYQQSDGSYTFVRNDYLGMEGSLSIDQNIWLTGGRLSLSTSLDYMRQLSGDKTRQFMSVPVALTFTQPIFGVNTVKWERRIEPLRYREAKAAYLSATEDVTLSAVTYFFNLLLAQENVNIAKQNLENARKLYTVAKAKREIGKISENDVLQMRLNLLDAESDLTNNESSLKNSIFKLRSFLALEDEGEIVPIVPDSMPDVELVFDEVLNKAIENNAFALNVHRRHLQADYDVAKARGSMREISLYAQVGLSGTHSNFAQSYSHVKDNQIVEVGVRIPILDWGRRRGQVKVAQSNRQVTENRLRQETKNFRQDLFILTEQFNNQRRQLAIAREADDIAERRYRSNVEAFMVGKISTLDLNDARESKDEARRNVINELFSYWYYYYRIRSITLWDFATDSGINADFDAIVK